MDIIRIALVEDARLSAEIIRVLLRREPKFLLVGIAATAAEGLALCRRERPRIAIVDWMLGDGDGCELIRTLAPELPETRWLLMSAYGCAELIEAADRVGAHGVLDKLSAGLSDLCRAIRRLHRGREYYCPASAELLRALRRDKSLHFDPVELEILRRLEAYQSRIEIARALGVDRSNVTRRIAKIARKLCVPEPPTISTIIACAQDAGALPNMPTRVARTSTAKLSRAADAP